MEEEIFISGFCRCQNQGRTVIAAYEEHQGRRTLLEVNCSYGSDCPHQASCQVAKQIDEVLSAE